MEGSGTDENMSERIQSSRTEWPSKGSILETPERKRYRSSISFADSGLGLSLFGSPLPRETPSTSTHSVMKTPTQKSSSINSTDLNSQLSSFLHVSAFSESFRSPDNSSVSASLRLTDPNKALECRFIGSFLPEHAQPINMMDNIFSINLPSTSHVIPQSKSFRATYQELSKVSPIKNNSASDEKMISDANKTTGYEAETPSKCFKNEISIEDSFDCDGIPLWTSTPVHDRLDNDSPECYMPLNVHYMVPEQANGPLESSLCDSAKMYRGYEQFMPMMVPETLNSDNVVTPKSTCHGYTLFRKQYENRGKENVVCRRSNKFEPLSRHCFRRRDIMNSLKVPIKALRVNSKKWLRIVFGETPHQIELTNSARIFLQSREM